MKVLVADDHEFVRGGLVSELMDIIPDAVFLQAGDASGVLDMLATNNDVKLAILDLYMPGSNQYELLNQVCKKYPDLLIVVMTASEDARDMQAVMNCGVSGYIPKTQGKDKVHHAVRLVLSGGKYFPEDILIDVQSSNPQSAELENKISALTHRQKEVLKLLLEGSANKCIANSLNLSENTVKIHVTAILRTLGFNSRTQVIAGVREVNFKPL